MNWAWASSLDQLWRSPAFPMWLTLAAAGFFAVIVLLTLVRAEKSVANGALTVITLLAVGIAVAATIRGFGPGGITLASRDSGGTSPAVSVSVPALSCIDDLAGETVETACEKTLFGSADTVAAATSYAASRISRLVAFGDVATANKNTSPELEALRRSVERDRYGLFAYVLAARDRCKPSDCAVYASLTDHNQIAANMEERIYDGLVLRYSASWNAPATTVAATTTTATGVQQPPPGATGRPTNADFPSSASIPPVNIMTPEPGPAAPPQAGRPPSTTTTAQTAAPRPPAAPAPAAPKKPPAPKTRATAPVQLAPAEPSADNN
jgi:hypothetical protein